MANRTELCIAGTIHAQLGGKRMEAMTGASNFVILRSGLRFSLPRNLARKGINIVQVHLNDRDLYDIHFMADVPQGAEKVIAITEDIDATMLRATFTEETGLAVSL